MYSSVGEQWGPSGNNPIYTSVLNWDHLKYVRIALWLIMSQCPQLGSLEIRTNSSVVNYVPVS